MKRFATALLAGFALLAFSSESFAGANANAKIVLHIGPKVTKNQCPAGRIPCQSIVTSSQDAVNGNGLYNFTYLLVTDGDATVGVAGVQCGINYSGGVAPLGGFAPINIYSWNLCAKLEFTSTGWPSPGGGNLITFNAALNPGDLGYSFETDCQKAEPGGAGTGVVAVAGYFYMGNYGSSCMSVTTRPVDNAAKVADCNAVEDIITGTPSHLGQACWGTAGPGFNPCGLITPVENSTWSNIKGNYSN